MKQAYITAVLEELLSGKDNEVVISNLKSVLIKKGHERLLGSIMRGALRQLEHDIVSKAPQIKIAKQDAGLLNRAMTALKDLGDEVVLEPVVKTDDNLIGGFVVTAANKQIDASYKRALLNLYRKVVS
jgi:F0F1-type ATP synthase delta subunit